MEAPGGVGAQETLTAPAWVRTEISPGESTGTGCPARFCQGAVGRPRRARRPRSRVAGETPAVPGLEFRQGRGGRRGDRGRDGGCQFLAEFEQVHRLDRDDDDFSGHPAALEPD